MHRHLFLSDIKGDLGLRPAARSPRDFQFAHFYFFLGVSMGASVGADSKKVNWQPHGMEIKSKKKPTNSCFII